MKKRRVSSIMHIASRTPHGPMVRRPATAHRSCPVERRGDLDERHIALRFLRGPSFAPITGLVSSVGDSVVAADWTGSGFEETATV